MTYDSLWGVPLSITSPSWAWPGGLVTTATSQGAAASTPGFWYIQAPFSLVWKGRQVGAPPAGSPNLFGISHDNINNPPYQALSLWWNSGALTAGFSNSATFDQLAIGGSLPAIGVPFMAGFSVTASATACYLNGVLTGSNATGTSQVNYGPGTQIGFAALAGKTVSPNVTHELGYLYQSALTPDLFGWLAAEPYAMFARPRIKRSFSLPPPGGGGVPIPAALLPQM